MQYRLLLSTVLIFIVTVVLSTRGHVYSQIRKGRTIPVEAVNIGPEPNAYIQAPSNPSNFNSGRVASIAVDPSDPSHWLVGFGNGGIWESRNAGGSFAPITDDQPTLATGAIAFAPSDPNTIYAGTGEPDGTGFTMSGLGLLKSTDGAKTWSLIAASSFARASVKRIRVHPSNPSVLLAATARGGFGRDSFEASPSPPPFGILRSIDGGTTWMRTLGGQATALEVDPTNFSHLYAAIADQRIGVNFNFALPPGSVSHDDPPGSALNGVHRSTDGGQTWVPVAGPWGASTATKAAVGRVELAISPSNPNTVYAGIQVPPNGGSEATGLLGLYRTDNAWDAAPAWISIPTAGTGDGGYCGPEKCGYAHTLSVEPSDPNTLFAFGGTNGGNGGWRCSNCGPTPTWTNVMQSAPVHPDHHALTWVGNRLIDGNDGGVWSTTDRGSTWQDHNRTISTNMFYSGALHPTNPGFIVGGMRDFALSVRNGSNTWLILPNPPWEWGEAEVAVSSKRPDTDWMGAWIWGVISRTTDAGKTAIEVDAGIDRTGVSFVAPVRKCPNNDDVFLTGTNRMWRTNNFFSSTTPSWVPNSPADTFAYPGTLGAPNTILSIDYVVSDTNCNTYAYGTRTAVRLTRDGGSTWSDLDPQKNLPPRPVNSLAFDPTNPSVLYAVLSDFDEATPGKTGHVFKTTNALSGAPAWANVSPALNEPFNVIAVDPAHPLTVYAGSDTGLFRSIDGGLGWKRVGWGTGLFSASVFDIKINPTTKQTVVFTYGRGAWTLEPSAVISR